MEYIDAFEKIAGYPAAVIGFLILLGLGIYVVVFFLKQVVPAIKKVIKVIDNNTIVVASNTKAWEVVSQETKELKINMNALQDDVHEIKTNMVTKQELLMYGRKM